MKPTIRLLRVLGCLSMPVAVWADSSVPSPLWPEQRFSPPELLEQQKDAPAIGLPSIPPAESVPLSRRSLVHARRIQLEGNTVFGAEDLGPITGKYENRDLSAEDLRQLRHELTVFYIDRGYVNSGAVLPEQTVVDGVVRVRIVEGRLTEVRLEGLERLRDSYVRARIARDGASQALNVKTLQEDLQLLQQNPLIQRINAELAPGLRPGEALLRARVAESVPYYLALGANNYGVPSVGAERFEVWTGHRNLTGYGDSLQGHLGLTEGQTLYDFHYALPFTARDSTFKLHYQNSEASVVERPFDELNIFNQAETIGFGFSQPMWRTLENSITLGVMAEHRHSKTFLLDEAFSFSRGSVNGVSKVSVLRFDQEWLNRTQSRAIAVRSVANWGVDVLDATVHSGASLPDSRFFSWLGQFQWIQRLGDGGLEMQLRGDAQIAADPLLSLEQFALGGMYSVRGYRQNQIVRDSGVATSLEFRVPLLRETLGEGKLFFTPFFDYGRAWNKSWPTPPPHALSSAGIGLRVVPFKQVHAEFYWARPLCKIENNGHDLQDSGIHFAVTYSPF